MPVLYHAPQSRSDTIATLVRMLKADIEIREVTIPRQDGSGQPDPDNPHPEKKVPYLVDGTETLREHGAIIVYLTDAYPDAGLGPLPGEPVRGAYLSWLFYYQGRDGAADPAALGAIEPSRDHRLASRHRHDDGAVDRGA